MFNNRVADLQIAALAVAAIGLAALGVWVVLRSKNNPEKKERERRNLLGQRGRFGDAIIDEMSDGFIYYTYSVQGVQYTASQDVTSLGAYLPAHAERLIGPASIKYASNNPGNSILLCEEWSGLRRMLATPAKAGSDDLAGLANGLSDGLSNGLSDNDAVGHQA